MGAKLKGGDCGLSLRFPASSSLCRDLDIQIRREPEAESKFIEMQVRARTGLGAEAASPH